MKNKLKLIFIVCFTLFISNNSDAKSYLDSKLINPILLTAPLDRSSLEFAEEVKQIVKMQSKAEILEIKKAENEDNLRLELMTSELDSNFSEKNFPETYKLLKNVFDTARQNSSKAKKFYATKRPYLENKEIKALITANLSAAYPSGHTCGSYVLAHILNLLQPQKGQVFYKRAEEIAMHRVLSGMHYPHDIDGGKQLALLVVGSLLQSEEFKQDFLRAKNELEFFKQPAD